MKRWLILLLFIMGFIFIFTALKGFLLIVGLFIIFPLFLFYCPLIFAGEAKKEEKTPEAKRDEEGRFGKWY